MDSASPSTFTSDGFRSRNLILIVDTGISTTSIGYGLQQTNHSGFLDMNQESPLDNLIR